MFEIKTVSAHCDIPCKIYDPAIFLVAGLSVARLVDLIQEESNDRSSLKSKAQLCRLIAEKEEQARIVKQEVNTIWGDYFKQPQLEEFPETHSLVHQIMQMASKCKQDVSSQNAGDLVALLNRFAEIFWTTKGVKTQLSKAPYPPALNIITPVLESA